MYELSAGDAVAQITQVLSGYSNISSVAIFSHGSEGALQLGSSSLNSANLMDYTGLLQSWSSALTEDADLLLYGCDVAADAIGQTFVSQLANLTGADVAASTNLTGSSALGGNWMLEFSTGSIEASEFLTDWAQAAYQNVLATFTVSNTNDSGAGSLRQEILDANAAAGADTINITAGGTITLGSELVISDDTTINGNGATISGNNASRVFFVSSGTVTLQNLTIANGKAQDGSGGTPNAGSGGGGAAGLGGGLFINAGSVSLSNVSFTGNQAVGGAGGAAGFDGLISGGGGGGIGGNGAGSTTNMGGNGGGGGALGGAGGAGGFNTPGAAGGSGAGH